MKLSEAVAAVSEAGRMMILGKLAYVCETSGATFDKKSGKAVEWKRKVLYVQCGHVAPIQLSCPGEAVLPPLGTWVVVEVSARAMKDRLYLGTYPEGIHAIDEPQAAPAPAPAAAAPAAKTNGAKG